MDDRRCEACGGRLRYDAGLQRQICGRCGRSGLVRGVEIVDWLGDTPVSRYLIAVEPTPARQPSQVYLEALRRTRTGQDPALR